MTADLLLILIALACVLLDQIERGRRTLTAVAVVLLCVALLVGRL